MEADNVTQVISLRKCVKNAEGRGLNNYLGVNMSEIYGKKRMHFLNCEKDFREMLNYYNGIYKVNRTDMFEKMKSVIHIKF